LRDLVTQSHLPSIRITEHALQTNDLLNGTFDASSVSVEGVGWFIFGGNQLKTSQKLVGIDSKWEVGPPVQSVGIWRQCAVQVKR